MPIREGLTGACLEIPLECESTCFISEPHRRDETPGARLVRVDRLPRVVCRYSMPSKEKDCSLDSLDRSTGRCERRSAISCSSSGDRREIEAQATPSTPERTRILRIPKASDFALAGFGGTIFAAQPRKLVEAAGIEPASENLYPGPLHAYPVPVFLAPVGQEPARSRREPSPKSRSSPGER